MTQEQKDLLLKDLCSRLPYKTKGYVNGSIEILESINTTDYIVQYGIYCYTSIDEFIPYLFPLSSMTEEQKKELFYLSGIDIIYGKFYTNNEFALEETLSGINWLLKNHFDYRGLIEMGLAIDCANLNIY